MSNQAHRAFLVEETLWNTLPRLTNEIFPHSPWSHCSILACRGCCAVSTPLPARKTMERKEGASPRKKCSHECLRQINMRVVFPQTPGV